MKRANGQRQEEQTDPNLASILKEMDSKAKNSLAQESE